MRTSLRSSFGHINERASVTNGRKMLAGAFDYYEIYNLIRWFAFDMLLYERCSRRPRCLCVHAHTKLAHVNQEKCS